MKITKLLLGLIILTFAASCGSQNTKEKTADKTEITEEIKARLAEGMTVEAACGECKFGLKGSECELAVRINGVAYFVDGADLDEFGDAHAADGMCNAVREAHVRGKIEGDRFTAHSFELVSDAHSHDDGHSHEH